MRLLAREADMVLVLGSQNSSNSQRLAELAAETGVRAHLIDGAAEIDLDLVPRRRNGADHRRRERPGVGRRRMRRIAARQVRRHGRAALDP